MKSQNAEFASIHTKLTVIMANRTTSYRIFKDRIDRSLKAPEQNVPSGTCVSEKIVSQRTHSFILNSQRALIGTALPVRYYVLDDIGRTFFLFKIYIYFNFFRHSKRNLAMGHLLSLLRSWYCNSSNGSSISTRVCS